MNWHQAERQWAWATLFLPAAALAACASFPVPTQRMADAESAHRSALELGANQQPAAQLHVKLAEEQMAQAKARIQAGENKEADSLLIRSKADSELAIALARETGARVETQRAVDKSNTTAATNTAEGAVK
jgi:parvulin-like peptidyl-prolyl isomerase